MKWITDDAGDLVNLANIRCILLAPLETDQLDDEYPDCTHEVLAVDEDQSTYRLAWGTEAACKTVRESIKGQLSNPQMHLIQPPEIVR